MILSFCQYFFFVFFFLKPFLVHVTSFGSVLVFDDSFSSAGGIRVGGGGLCVRKTIKCEKRCNGCIYIVKNNFGGRERKRKGERERETAIFTQ